MRGCVEFDFLGAAPVAPVEVVGYACGDFYSSCVSVRGFEILLFLLGCCVEVDVPRRGGPNPFAQDLRALGGGRVEVLPALVWQFRSGGLQHETLD